VILIDAPRSDRSSRLRAERRIVEWVLAQRHVHDVRRAAGRLGPPLGTPPVTGRSVEAQRRPRGVLRGPTAGICFPEPRGHEPRRPWWEQLQTDVSRSVRPSAATCRLVSEA